MPTDDVDAALDKRVREIREAVAACREAMIDLTVEEKVIVVDQLRGWVELEHSTHEQQH